jgi:hypothetical protein
MRKWKITRQRLNRKLLKIVWQTDWAYYILSLAAFHFMEQRLSMGAISWGIWNSVGGSQAEVWHSVLANLLCQLESPTVHGAHIHTASNWQSQESSSSVGAPEHLQCLLVKVITHSILDFIPLQTLWYTWNTFRFLEPVLWPKMLQKYQVYHF